SAMEEDAAVALDLGVRLAVADGLHFRDVVFDVQLGTGKRRHADDALVSRTADELPILDLASGGGTVPELPLRCVPAVEQDHRVRWWKLRDGSSARCKVENRELV